MPSKRSAVSTVPAQDRPGLTAQGRQQIQERIDEIQHARLEELRPLLAERERDERDVATFERLLAEALELQALIDAADVLPAIDEATFDGRLALGMRARITVADGSEAWVRPVHPGEAHLDDERISMDSPLALALLGARVDSTVWVAAPSGLWNCQVLEIDVDGART